MSQRSSLSRREFLAGLAMTAVGVAAASCAQPTPQVIEKEVPVEKVVKETVVVSKEVPIEKVVTATPVVAKYKEAPMLAGLVQEGKLPPVDQRLPTEPVVVTPWEEIGQYGGTWHRLALSVGDIRVPDRLVYDNLLRWDKDGGEVITNVCNAYELNATGNEFTFHLPKGMKWSDGQPYTSEDIQFYFEDIIGNEELTPAIPFQFRPGDQVVKFAKVDDATFKLTFAVPYALFPGIVASSAILDMNLRPKHYCQQFHVKYADKTTLDKLTKDAGYEFWYQLYAGMTTGAAFKTNLDLPVIHAWHVTVPPPKQPVVFERNPYFYKVDTEGNQLPYIDRVEHMLVESSDIVNQRAMGGEVDMQFRNISFNNYPLFVDNAEKGDYRILKWQKGNFDTGLFTNPFYEDKVLADIFADKRFRFALSLGINRQEIIDSIYLGVTEPSQISPPKASPFYWDEYAKTMTEYDVDRANAYLDEMGLTQKDSEGYRLRSDGKRLTIIYEYANAFFAWGDIGELLKAHWQKLGIELIITEEARELFDERRTAPDKVQMHPWMTDATFSPLITRPYYCARSEYYASNTDEWWQTKGKSGVEPTGDILKLYQLNDQFEAAGTMEEWKTIFRQMLEIDKDNLFYIGICTSAPEVVIVKNNFRNVPDMATSDWTLLTPGNTKTEQYFIKQS